MKATTRRELLRGFIPAAADVVFESVGNVTDALTAPPKVWARIDRARCIAHTGIDCGACAGWCPPGTHALTLRAGRPEIDALTCVGCGDCITGCPVLPAAIEFEEEHP
jgi:NAD-dependent dihydropyrimidine dehydrogenase PreA subunit